MYSKISDIALDFGIYALDNELENGEMIEDRFATQADAACQMACSAAA